MAGDRPNRSSEEVVDRPLVAGPKMQLTDAPILVFVCFHKALRAEFAELRRVVAEVSENGGSYGEDFIVDIRTRFEFLKLVYKYHSAAEDEIIFLALDAVIKNVINTYALEHKSVDELFDDIFHCLDVLDKEDRDVSKPFQELVYCIDTIHATICQHMLKEEEQVFPLLMQQFSSREQASLVCQFMCSVPVTLLEDFLPWMSSFLSSDEQVEILHCMREVVPDDYLLQEVLISWISDKSNLLRGRPSGTPFFYGTVKHQGILKVYSSQGDFGENQQLTTTSLAQAADRHNPINYIHIWHSAIKKDMQEVLVELHQIRTSKNISDLASLLVQLNFFADSLNFYSKALNKIFYPLWSEIAKDFNSPCCALFLDEEKIEGLQKLLYYKSQCAIPLGAFVEKLCGELDSFVSWMNKHLALLETEMFPFIGMRCSRESQHLLLYRSLKMMPLGLLKCMITWFSAHLTEAESKSLLNVNLVGPLASETLKSLLCDWVRISYSGKSTIEKFREELREMFDSRCSFLYEQIKEDTGLSNFQLVTNKYQPTSSSISNSNRNYDTSYSSGMNFIVFSPKTLKIPSHIIQLSTSSSGPSSFSGPESRPMDHIIFFHKALKKDLEYLVFVSAKLAENIGFLKDFHDRFHLLRLFYQIHSDSEDGIAFPALEAKRNFQNISHSYTIDHKLEGELFIKVSSILDEISNLIGSVYSGDFHALDQREPKYGQLCVTLHGMCILMHKVLCDHIHHEEIELFPLFRKHFSLEEQEKITGQMLGRIRSEVLQEMIPWLMASLTPDEQHAMMSLWRNATKNTKFDEWLGEWWEGEMNFSTVKVEKQSNALPLCTVNPLEVALKYLVKGGRDDKGGILCDRSADLSISDSSGGHKDALSETPNVTNKDQSFKQDQQNNQSLKCEKVSHEFENNKGTDRKDESGQTDETGKLVQISQRFRNEKHLPVLSQEELMAAIRRVSGDSDLDLQSKSFIIQNLLTSRWTVAQKKLNSEITAASNNEKFPGQSPSYRDPHKLIFGCKHYKRNCKLVSACCNDLYTCRLCHDDVADHSMDRKATTKMMCMKCLIIQPVGPTCSTPACHKLSMARYYCRVCNLFDDEREIYHCPYCNLCRVGKGLGIDYFHCMTCNACMSRSLSVHICREKCFEDYCPICHEFIFTSSSPVKALPCGHLMHSTCFKAYTCSHYTCPICSKSLGDMQVYFGMLDALLAEEKLPLEHVGQTQDILCNDCEKRGNASFHWLYHKCPHCGSYNTRLL